MLVFGHRGACGYLPENTIESFKLAFQLGVDAIEFDVVLTSDSVPVIRHDDDLTPTTDVLDRNLPSTLVHELTLEQINSVRARERYENRVESRKFDSKFKIPTLATLMGDSSFDGKHLILEIKYGKFLKSVGLDPITHTAEVIKNSNWKSRGMKLTIECFEFAILRDMRDYLDDPEIDYVFLSASDMLPNGETQLTFELVEEIAKEFDGLSVAIPMVLESNVLELTKHFGIPLYTYTARVETAQGSYQEWFAKLANTGVQGIFADQPDLMIQAVRGNA